MDDLNQIHLKYSNFHRLSANVYSEFDRSFVDYRRYISHRKEKSIAYFD
jgi:hypothetical protein